MLVSEMTFLRNYWHPVAETATLDGPTAVRLFGQDYVVWDTADGAYAMSEAFCPHRSAHLSGGWISDGEIVCPYHGWRFDGSGACTHVPQLDQDLPIPPRAKLVTYPVAERYGVLWACVGDQPVSEDPPRWPEAEAGGWRVYVEFFETWNVAAPRIIDNNLDSSHVAYVHRSTFGDPKDALLPPVEFDYTETGFVSHMTNEQPGIGMQLGVTTDEARRFRRTSETQLLAPLTTRTRMYFDGAGPDYCFFGAASPTDDSHSIYVRFSALAGSEAEQPWDRFHSFGTRVKEEDRVILESTVPDFPVNITSEVHLRCDKVTLEYRKYLAACLESAPVSLRRSA